MTDAAIQLEQDLRVPICLLAVLPGQSRTPTKLERAEREVLNELVGIYSSAPQERSGVFSTAQLLVSCLTDAAIMDWVNPRPGEEHGTTGRTLFDPVKFMDGTNTLYSLSTDGYGSAKALVTALTQSVLDAATDKAKTQPGGRLSLPMVCVEATSLVA